MLFLTPGYSAWSSPCFCVKEVAPVLESALSFSGSLHFPVPSFPPTCSGIKACVYKVLATRKPTAHLSAALPHGFSSLSVKPGVRYRELGNIIQRHAQANGFSVVRSYCGHGIHKLFHTAPNVPHYASEYCPNTWLFLLMNKYSSVSQGLLICIH